MKKLLLLLSIFYTQLGIAQETEVQIKVYSYTEFFQLIEEEQDTIFSLKNARIEFDSLTDMTHAYTGNLSDSLSLTFYRTDTIFIKKAIEFDNVFFTEPIGRSNKYEQLLHHIVFEKTVTTTNSIFNIAFCQFKDRLVIFYNEQYFDALESQSFQGWSFTNSLLYSEMQNGLGLISYSEEEIKLSPNLRISDNKVFLKPDVGNALSVLIRTGSYLNFLTNNTFLNKGTVIIAPFNGTYLDIVKNDFGDADVRLSLNERFIIPKLTITKNQFNRPVAIEFNDLPSSSRIDWDQFKGGIYNEISFMEYHMDLDDIRFNERYNSVLVEKDSLLNAYLNVVRVENKEVYKIETLVLGKLNTLYKAQLDLEFANASYVAIKDLETQRQEYLYRKTPGFNTFFKWKINQFLKIFSAYGTEPARAITFSVYVILAFALVYLFFPNHWDSHGKNRIKDRFLFFHKYLRLNKGIQDVYLEEKQEEIQSSHAFRKILDDHKDEVPPFFYNAAGPLLKWSTASTTIYSNLLRRVDFLKGSWKDTDTKVRGFKTALTIIIFIIALCYDLFIKMLNALMLSINTFTTLGFGEIPIKGLPRYLAIIQGFIGWFMLTIFSVSLISQLLN